MTSSRGVHIRSQTELVPCVIKVDEDDRRTIATLNAPSSAVRRIVDEQANRVINREAPIAGTIEHDLVGRCMSSILRHNYAGGGYDHLLATGFEEAAAKAISSVCELRRPELLAAYEAMAPAYPSLEGLRWRVDVIISSSSVNKVMRPSILMELTLDDGTMRSFEVPLDKFHELRYNTAKVLLEMGAVEGHPVLRIQ